MAAPQETPLRPARSAAPDGERESVARLVGELLAAPVRRVDALPSGIGLRRFYRVWTGAEPATLIARVDAREDPAGRPAAADPEPPLEPIRALLEDAGLPVPRLLGAAADGSILLLEDLGSRPLSEVSPPALDDFVVEALALLPRLQRIAPTSGVQAFSRRLDATLLAYKADLFARYSLPETLGRPPRPAEVRVVRDAFAWIAERLAEAPQRLAHRDFQSQNLLVAETRPAGRRVSMIDLQGAFLAPPEYDAVCLLRDAALPLSEDAVVRHQERLRPLLPDAPEARSFTRRFDWLTLTRKGKDHARFLYAARERGDRRFLGQAAATARMLRAAGRRRRDDARELARLADLLETLPEETPCAG